LIERAISRARESAASERLDDLCATFCTQTTGMIADILKSTCSTG
jgi:hypothetical protein